MIWFTSDWHLRHENIIKYCSRPFNSIKQMDNSIINLFNSTVANEDIVYFLGDLTLSNDKIWIEKIIKNLKGEKHLIVGNHDKLNLFDYVKLGFLSVHTSLELDHFALVHDPVFFTRQKTILCGHVHNLFKIQKNVINVGIDVWEFKPVSYETIKVLI
ncbi:MAG: hypothetical protein ABH817_01360 [archaeon]